MTQPQTDVHGVQVVGNPPPVSMKPVALLPFWLEPTALLLLLSLLTWALVRVLRRRPAAWPVPSLLGLEVGRPEATPVTEPEGMPESVQVSLSDEMSPVAADAEAARESREEEAEVALVT